MTKIRDRNVFGALALMISDDIIRATEKFAPEAGPAASALALLNHQPGLSIRTLSAGVGITHAGTVRLVDRLVADGLVERRDHFSDGRTKALHLTSAGEKASAAVLEARDKVIAEELAVLSPAEVVLLAKLSERVLRARLRDLDHAYNVCRLCEYSACKNCPVEEELRQRDML
jgi:DNA-binding MarR family transcriptional regulator